MLTRIEVQFQSYNLDTRARMRTQKIRQDFPKVERVYLADVYTITKQFTTTHLEKIASALTNPVIQRSAMNESVMRQKFSFAIEVGYLPGVTDNTGRTAQEISSNMLRTQFTNSEAIYFSQVHFIVGNITKKNAQHIAQSLMNPLIQRAHIKSYAEYTRDAGMDVIVPEVHLTAEPKVDRINLNIPTSELEQLGKLGVQNNDGTRRGPLALDVKALKIIKAHFKKIGRKPTDAELEMLAQTWSEHCKHTIFASEIDNIKDGLYRHYIQKATQTIRTAKGKQDFCVSVFSDNSGAIVFDEDWLITDKVETHNSPSALDPFGGAVTGIVGVNRDTIGFGKGALPVINKYGYCLADPSDDVPLFQDKARTKPMLSPRRILDGIVAGVNTGGNCSGIPTPQGFVYFHERYKGKPLVFVGTVGLIPKKINGKPSWLKKAEPGDHIVMVGGKVGADGIHGATFSSESLSSGSPATAVQIGDPYTQKKLSDAIIKEARQQELYNSITDNGAGGLSSSVGEMAKEAGGCEVDLALVPLKYPGLQPWQIWISESQERMTLAVSPAKLEAFQELMGRRDVGVWVIGRFTNTGKCHVQYGEQEVIDIDLEFLHHGNPKYALQTNWKKPSPKTLNHKTLISLNNQFEKNFFKLLSSPSHASYSFISYQYDYEVLGGSTVKPLQGVGQVNGVASVTRPILSSKRGVVCSQALYPRYSELDPYAMAGAAIDTAIRNCIAVGGSLDHLALLDNFCWCSGLDPVRLGQLKEAAQGAHDYAVAYGTPFISGKDSMFNDFSGYDKHGKPVKISIPPTLLISATGVVSDTEQCVTLDAKHNGDLVYVLGETKNELGGSEFLALQKKTDGFVPQIDAKSATQLYRVVEEAIRNNLIASAQSIIHGGLAMALAKTAIGGRLGLKIDLSTLARSQDITEDVVALYSETQSRLLVTVAPRHQRAFEKLFQQQVIAQIGTVTTGRCTIQGVDGKILLRATVQQLEQSYKKTFANY